MDIEEIALKNYPRREKLNKKGTGTYDPNYQRRNAFLYGYRVGRSEMKITAEEVYVIVNLYNEYGNVDDVATKFNEEYNNEPDSNNNKTE